MSEVKTMTCVQCGRSKAWPDAFPSTIDATCWRCAWASHIHSDHPRIVRRIKRVARKRARRRAESEIQSVMFDDELHQAFGISPTERAGDQA